ncbi:hypothetical protein WOA01_02265 [Methylocystis sp. IM2]|uniref:hypothetical protein n=1 Tax=Methylocystis sp. IM2 TaxID=3136563 RepID=UPI0030F589F4
MRHDRSCRNLNEKQQRHHDKVFADSPLASRKRSKFRQDRIHSADIALVEKELVNEQHDAEGEEGEAETDPSPPEGVEGRRIADQGLKRPILGPGPAGARPARHRGEGREDQKSAVCRAPSGSRL